MPPEVYASESGLFAATVLDHGFVELENVSHGERESASPHEPMEAMDLAVANAARVSFMKRSDKLTDADRGLIRALLRDKHATPFEHPSMSWRANVPVFALREWHRHRTASISEASARYTEVPDLFYVPAAEHMRTQIGKANAYTFEQMPVLQADRWRSLMEMQNREAFALYHEMIDGGVAKEVARTVLPVSMYSEMIWTVNARNLMGFLTLRNAAPAQLEIRLYAEAMEAMFAKVMPVTHAAYVEFGHEKL